MIFDYLASCVYYGMAGWLTGYLIGRFLHPRRAVAAESAAEIPQHVDGEIILSCEHQAAERATREQQEANGKMKATLSGLALELNRQPVLLQIGLYGTLLYAGLLLRQRTDKAADKGSESRYV